MKLYLSSFRVGNQPSVLLDMLAGRIRTGVILNASDHKDPDERHASLAREFADLRAIGLEPTELDLRDHFDNPGSLRQRMSEFDLAWVRGGNVFVLRRALKQSGADSVITGLLLEDKLVYGGYSAGAVVMTPSLHGLELVDNPYVIPDGYDKSVVWDGLGVVPYRILPHYRSDHPESDAIEKSVQFLVDNHTPFVALRDGEAIVRNGHRENVVGGTSAD